MDKKDSSAAFEVEYRRASDLPDDLRAWLKERARAAIRIWLDWGVLAESDLPGRSSPSYGASSLPYASMARAVVLKGGSVGEVKTRSY